MFGLRTARSRAILAGALLVVLLASIATVAVWRAQDDRQRHHALEHTSATAMALESARAEFHRELTMLSALVFSDDPALFDKYQDAAAAVEQHLSQARAAALAEGQADEVLGLDDLAARVSQFNEKATPSLSPEVDPETAARSAIASMAEMVPEAEAIIADLEELVDEEQQKLAAVRAAADRSAESTLWLLIGFSAAAFVVATGTIAMLIVSVVRPLASLRASARAITSGDLEARAVVSGPEEVASLARDFNEMTDALSAKTLELSKSNEELRAEVTERKQAEEALRESEERYRDLFENANDLIQSIAPDGSLVYVNRAWRNALGYSDEEIRGLSLFDIIHPDSKAHCTEMFQRVLAGEKVDHIEAMFVAKDRSAIWVEGSASCRFEDGKPVATRGIFRDMTERKRADEAREKALRDMGERMKELACIYRVTDLTQADQTMEELLQEVVSVIPSGWQYPKITRAKVRFDGQEYVSEPFGETPWKQSSDIVIRGEKQGTVEVCYLEERPELDEGPFQKEERNLIEGIARVLAEAAERKRAEEALREQSRRDPLTGELNHAAILAELRDLLSSDGHDTSHAVAMIDVDGLKATNDTYGHQVGDAVLVAVAGALSRDGTLVGRYGGDEFLAVLPGADRASAQQYREEVPEALAGAGLTDPETGASVPIVVSVGLSIYPDDAEAIEDLIKLSDSAMYASRRQRPIVPGALSPSRPAGDARVAEMVGQLVPLLTSPGNLGDKLRLVSHRISVGAGYDAVNIDVFARPTGLPSGRNVFAQVPDEVIDAWRAEGRRREEDPFVQVLLRTRRPLIVQDPQNDERLTETQRAVLRAAQLKSAVVVPLFWGDELIGSLSVASKQEAAFTPRDLEFLTAVATQIASIVHTATLVDDLQSATTSLGQAHDETVMMLAAAAEAHDPTTGRHLQGVRAVAEALARELGYSDEDARELGLAAVLHDIGKIRVPDSILSSSGKLTVQEWEVMKQHSIWGWEFLTGRPGFEHAATIARSHHERWDGSGYPDGLSGEDIPEAATIVAVADSLDAMTSHRPYRARRSVAAAVREIAACSGSQFSPRVVEALVRLHKKKRLPISSKPELAHARA